MDLMGYTDLFNIEDIERFLVKKNLRSQDKMFELARNFVELKTLPEAITTLRDLASDFNEKYMRMFSKDEIVKKSVEGIVKEFPMREVFSEEIMSDLQGAIETIRTMIKTNLIDDEEGLRSRILALLKDNVEEMQLSFFVMVDKETKGSEFIMTDLLEKLISINN